VVENSTFSVEIRYGVGGVWQRVRDGLDRCQADTAAQRLASVGDLGGRRLLAVRVVPATLRRF